MSANEKRLCIRWNSARLLRLLAALACGWLPQPAMANVGMAEWDLKTPGSNLVCHTDPFISQHGTCLRPADKDPGVIAGQTVHVSHLEWWQYFKGQVIGKARREFFVFDEITKAVGYFDTEAELQARLKQHRELVPICVPVAANPESKSKPSGVLITNSKREPISDLV